MNSILRTAAAIAPFIVAAISVAAEPELPLVVREDFEHGADRWQPTDPAAWKIIDTPQGKALSQFRASHYEPPHRSPFNIALLKDIVVGDFVLQARVQSTVKDYDHRDLCLVFGYQGPARFYYVHFANKTDDHANQIFIVNDKPREKISTKTTAGTPWTDAWHTLKVVRKVDDGTIETYFDDLEHPIMTARDNSFTWGQIGIGSFDDTGNFDDVELRGMRVERPNSK